MTESHRSCELPRLVVTEGCCLPADSPLQAFARERAGSGAAYRVTLPVKRGVAHLHTQETAPLPPG